jgi:exo-beta-1,3-glucanase (GH17 family)
MQLRRIALLGLVSRLRTVAVAVLVGLAGCSSSGPGGHGGPDAAVDANRRAIPDEALARRAIAYSGYRMSESPEIQAYPSEQEIKEDLQLLIRGHWTFIRLFDCSVHAQRVLQVIKDNAFDIEVMSGVWIAGGKADHDQENRAEIERCVALDNQYKDIIVAVSVGNETLDSWSDVRTSPAELAAYITEVRGRVPQPVTTDDMFLPFTLVADSDADYSSVIEVAKVVDFLSLHIYAFVDAQYDSWDWEQWSVAEGHERAVAMMNEAMRYTRSSIAEAAAAMAHNGLSLPILIGEAGWKSAATGSSGDPTEVYRAHPVNQKMFYDSLVSWVYGAEKEASSPKAAFYFEAFDEPWKADDDGWGLFDTNRNAKYAIWDSFPERKPPGAPNYSDDDAVYDKQVVDGGIGAVDAN